MNVVSGLPRAGTTLLCNILNQNKDFHASSTSGLCEIISTISHKITTMDEITSDMIADNETPKRLKKAMQSFCKEYYDTDKVVFDKSRGWSINYMLLKELYPETKAIVCMRDPRDVFASIEKQHRKNGIFDYANSSIEKSISHKVESFFSPDGMIGSAVSGIEDLIRRKQDNIFYLKFEEFVKQPEFMMREIYKYLEIDYFDHDFKNIVNTSSDIDGLYRNKFPHKGNGEVREVKSNYNEYFNKGVADYIINKYPLYSQAFGYTID